MDEALYTVGRRFPSIRVKSKDRKDAKKELYATPDKSINRPLESGSCARPVAAIYGTITNEFQSKMSLPESNIYENERIILQQNNKTRWCKKPKTSHVLLSVMILSVIIFLSAGAILLYKPSKYTLWDRVMKRYHLNQFQNL